MIKSMTAFGRAKSEGADKDITLEIKSVNSRYFDCTVKAPRAYLYMEEKIKTYIQTEVISRGKVDVYITVENHNAGIADVEVDMAYARGYLEALQRLQEELKLRDDISVMRLAENKDLFSLRKREDDTEGDFLRVKELLAEASRGYTLMRVAEGERIAEDILQKLAHIRRLWAEIEPLTTADIGQYHMRLENRLRTVLKDNNLAIDDARILTECAIFADKIAIDEELVRLNVHFESFMDMLQSDEPIGRKLDFLMQEMNRETNTIGSKCANAVIAQKVVSIKSELEKIREQIQNME